MPKISALTSATALDANDEFYVVEDGNSRKCTIPQMMAVSALGWGQTWQDVTASRAYATSYQNTTGRPISVSVMTGNNSTSGTSYTFDISENNSTWLTIALGNTSNDDNYGFRGSFIVPNGIYYRVTRSGSSTAAINAWVELR